LSSPIFKDGDEDEDAVIIVAETIMVGDGEGNATIMVEDARSCEESVVVEEACLPEVTKLHDDSPWMQGKRKKLNHGGAQRILKKPMQLNDEKTQWTSQISNEEAQWTSKISTPNVASSSRKQINVLIDTFPEAQDAHSGQVEEAPSEFVTAWRERMKIVQRLEERRCSTWK